MTGSGLTEGSEADRGGDKGSSQKAALAPRSKIDLQVDDDLRTHCRCWIDTVKEQHVQVVGAGMGHPRICTESRTTDTLSFEARVEILTGKEKEEDIFVMISC